MDTQKAQVGHLGFELCVDVWPLRKTHSHHRSSRRDMFKSLQDPQLQR